MELAKGETLQRKDSNDTERVGVTLNSQGRLQRIQVRQKGSLSAALILDGRKSNEGQME